MSIKSLRGEENIIRILSKNFLIGDPSLQPSLPFHAYYIGNPILLFETTVAERRPKFLEENNTVLEFRTHEYANTRSILEHKINEYTKYTRIQITGIHEVYLNTKYMNTQSILEYRIHQYTKYI